MNNQILNVAVRGVFADVFGVGVRFGWAVMDGFGELQIKANNDGTVRIDSEHMSKEFVVAVLTKLVDNAELVD